MTDERCEVNEAQKLDALDDECRRLRAEVEALRVESERRRGDAERGALLLQGQIRLTKEAESALASERESRLRSEREHEEARRQVELWYEAVSLHLTATKHGHPAAVSCEACEFADGGWCASCRPLAGLLTERHIAHLTADDPAAALSSPSVTTGGQEAGANAPAPPMEPCACSSCGFDAERCACATPVFVAKASMSAEPANHAEAGEELRRRVFEALGAASMCWTETPHGIFESDRAKRIGDDLVAWLASGTPRAAPSKTSEGA